MTTHHIADADVGALDHDCPTCGRRAGKRCAVLRRADGKPTSAHLAPTRCHPERNMAARRAARYEKSILETATRNGWTATRAGEFIELSNAEGVVRHRLHGPAERAYNDRVTRELLSGDGPQEDTTR